MNTLDINKTVAAVLSAGIAYMGATLIADYAVRPARLEKLAIKIEGPAAPAASGAEAGDPPVAVLLASADVGRGQQDTMRNGCVACHSFNEGGKAGIGPNLYGVVGAPHGHMEGYAYSTALKAKQGPWTYDELYAWLKKPSAYAPGTKMTYAGLADPKQRADIIDYLRSLSHNPQPLPAAPAGGAQVASAGGGTGAAAGGTAAGDPPVDTLLASADAGRGEADTKRNGCVACHSFNQGGKAGIGPNLYGVFGGPHGHMVGYNYSAALKAKQGPWTADELYAWLKKPSAYAPGTKMTYAGLADAKQRADIIAYLKSISPPGSNAAAAAPASNGG